MRNSFVHLGTFLFVLLVLFLAASIVSLIFQWPIAMDSIKLTTFGTLGQMIAALVSLGVVWSAFYITVRKPQITLTPPRKIRFEITPRLTAFYIQPTFSIDNVTTSADRITAMDLEVRRIDTSTGSCHDLLSKKLCETFFWQYIVRFRWQREGDTEVYGGIVSDAVPLPVTFTTPQAPMACFVRHATDKWWQASESYCLTLRAESASGKPLQTTIEVELEKNVIRDMEEAIDSEGEGQYRIFYQEKVGNKTIYRHHPD